MAAGWKPEKINGVSMEWSSAPPWMPAWPDSAAERIACGDLRSFELHQNDRLLGAQEVGHDADHFQVELLNLVARKDRVGVALHARTHLIDRKYLIQRGLYLRAGRTGEQ